jgi:hypothetical protein
LEFEAKEREVRFIKAEAWFPPSKRLTLTSPTVFGVIRSAYQQMVRAVGKSLTTIAMYPG